MSPLSTVIQKLYTSICTINELMCTVTSIVANQTTATITLAQNILQSSKHNCTR